MENGVKKLVAAMTGCLIADAKGAGHEMNSREDLLSNVQELNKRYFPRDPKFSKGYTPGDYTDDFEMTLAVLMALKEGDMKLNVNVLYKYFYQLYFETKEKFGVARAGYGSVSKLLEVWKANGYEEFQKELLKSMLTVKKNVTGDDAPGNASLMRMTPIVFSKSYFEMIENALVNALSTKPHGYIVFSCVALAIAGRYLTVENGDPHHLIDHTLKKFEEWRPFIMNYITEKREQMLQNVPNREEVEFLELEKLDEQFNHMSKQLSEIDQLPQPANPDSVYGPSFVYDKEVKKCNDKDEPDPIDGVNYYKLMYPYASPLKGKTGLGAKGEQTLYCALYCLKWHQQTTLWGNLLRIILFGGDTDTLGVCVLPYIYEWHCNNGSCNLPAWLFDNGEMYDPKIKRYGFNPDDFEKLVCSNLKP